MLLNLVFVCDDAKQNVTKTILKVMKQYQKEQDELSFEEHDHHLNGLSLYPSSQPFILDLNGDLM